MSGSASHGSPRKIPLEIRCESWGGGALHGNADDGFTSCGRRGPPPQLNL